MDALVGYIRKSLVCPRRAACICFDTSSTAPRPTYAKKHADNKGGKVEEKENLERVLREEDCERVMEWCMTVGLDDLV